MRLHRFYIREAIGGRQEVTVASAVLVNQISKVLRLRINDEVILFDGSGSDYLCQITNIAKDSVTFRVISSSASRYVPKNKLYLCAAVVKKDNFEFMVEKATELGVTDIVPVLAERSEKKALNMERLNKIAVEASEQSGRGTVPVIHEITGLIETIKDLAVTSTQLMAFHTEGDPLKLAPNAPTAVFIGPEGGWSPEEIEVFHKNKVALACLGPQVLRAETAVVAALSQVVFGR